MILLAHTITSRLRYIADLIATQITGRPFIITSNLDEYKANTGARINYTANPVMPGEYWVQPHTLLFEKGIAEVDTRCREHDGMKFFFTTGGDLPFDIFAASFYLLSRYEEYLPHLHDSYGRYAHDQSLAHRESFLQQPLVNKWILFFCSELRTRFPDITFDNPEQQFRFLPTYDIDEAFSYRHKSLVRVTGAVGKAVLKGQFSQLSERWQVLNRTKQDPFYAYDWMDVLHGAYRLKPRYFFLLAANTGKYDRNNLPSEPAMQALVKRHADKYDIGIHPSWQSGDDDGLLLNELSRLEEITGKKINSSRQHYIRFNLPETFRKLLDAGIREDYSMGYGSINGFRASYAGSFYWYDLLKEEKTTLLLHPFCYMEANSFFEQHYTATQALDEMRHYYQEVKKVSGLLITIWHNSFLGTGELYKGWREVYQQFMEEIS